MKDKFTGGNRKSVLASCEFGEDAAQRAYKSALEDEEISPDVRSVVERQKSELLEAHDQVKAMRDTAAAER